MGGESLGGQLNWVGIHHWLSGSSIKPALIRKLPCSWHHWPNMFIAIFGQWHHTESPASLFTFICQPGNLLTGSWMGPRYIIGGQVPPSSFLADIIAIFGQCHHLESQALGLLSSDGWWISRLVDEWGHNTSLVVRFHHWNQPEAGPS